MSEFTIDELALDREWNRQGDLAFQFNKIVAECQREYDEAKAELEVTRGELYKRVKANPKKAGLDKATEAGIKEVIPTLPPYKTAIKKVIDARYELDIAKAASIAIEHKKRGLEKVVDLFLNNYYGEPRARSDNREAVEDMTKREVRRRSQKKRRSKKNGEA